MFEHVHQVGGRYRPLLPEFILASENGQKLTCITPRRPRTSGIFSAPNHLSNKIVLSPKIFTNTYRMELNLCQLNSVNVLLHIT